MSDSSSVSPSNKSHRTASTNPEAQTPVPTTRLSAQHGTIPRRSPYGQIPEPNQEYVSPYPPLPPACTQSGRGRIAAITSTQAMQTSATPSSSATAVLAAQEVGERAQKRALIACLNEHRINTIGELRRVERIFATLGSSDLTQPMTAAWVYYVNSNSLLTELRGLTKNYPFSSECLEEAKRRVHQDPASNRSWNYCWLVLAKVHTDRLIQTYAHAQASRPEMWGGRIPLAESVNQLSEAFVAEWNAALTQLLRYWEAAPIR